MEARKITIVSTKNQKKSVIMSAATTLSELKADLRQNGIDYDGMTFYEGTSKVELKDDNSVLPHDVPYKGTVTNELVFMLTNTNKKIRSGAMTRAEAYDKIRSMNLQSECVKRFGRNFTMCSTANLVALIEEKSKKSAKTTTTTVVEKKVETKVEEQHANPTEYVDTKARAAIAKLVDILNDNGTLDYEECEVVESILGGKVVIASEDYTPKSVSPYLDDEIDEMFAFTK